MPNCALLQELVYLVRATGVTLRSCPEGGEAARRRHWQSHPDAETLDGDEAYQDTAFEFMLPRPCVGGEPTGEEAASGAGPESHAGAAAAAAPSPPPVAMGPGPVGTVPWQREF